MIGVHISAARKVFDAHVCVDHPPLKNIEKTSGPIEKVSPVTRVDKKEPQQYRQNPTG
jgi:hypothetical protein